MNQAQGFLHQSVIGDGAGEDLPQASARLREILTGPVTDDALVEEALGLIHQSTGRERALEDVESCRQRAEEELNKLPEGETTSALRELMNFALQRLG